MKALSHPAAKYIITLLTFGICIIPIFYKLSQHPIYIWDEAIYANNSLEMSKDWELFVLKVNGEPNLYNSKPPLAIWCQALSIKIFGPNEFAIRFPGALAALGTCMVLYLFSVKALGHYLVGCISVLILVSCPGYIRHHVTRTGDLDSVLVFFTTLYSCVAVLYFIKKPPNPTRYFILISIGIILSFLTKSVAGLIPLAGLLIPVLTFKRLRFVLKSRMFYLSTAVVLLFIIGFYILRELTSTGYVGIAMNSEYLRYFVNIMPWHEHPFSFYMRNWFSMGLLLPYLWIIPIATYFAIRTLHTRFVSILLSIWCVVYLLIISIPRVKLEWYDAPMYPFIALLLGIGIYNILILNPENKLLSYSKHVLAILLIGGALYNTIHKIDTNNHRTLDPLEREGSTIKELSITMPEEKKYDVIMVVNHPAHLTQALFYSNAYALSKGTNINILESTDQISIGNKYLICQENIEQSIWNLFDVDVMFENKLGCKLILIRSNKVN